MKTLAYSLLLLCSAVLMVWAGKWMIADVWTHSAHRLMQAWEDEKAPRVPDEIHWRRAVFSLSMAHDLAPGDPDLLSELGRWRHRWALEHPPWSAKTRALLEQTISYYQKAIRRRPSWGLFRLNLAEAGIQAGRPTQSILEDLKRAILLDPWSPEAQKGAARLGFILWPRMNEADRRGIRQLFEKALERQPFEIIQLAVRFNRVEAIRPLLQGRPKWVERLQRLQAQ